MKNVEHQLGKYFCWMIKTGLVLKEIDNLEESEDFY